MPVDATKPRKTQRKLTEEEVRDIEQKRSRGEISCAECRRLKLRCDKQVPCSSCVRRGCESICPLGRLSAGHGTRFILADTDQLHHKIAEMSHRIRQLEDGLAILQASVSSERHPLLTDDLVKIKFGPEAPRSVEVISSKDSTEKVTVESIDALGTLTLNSDGEMRYFGRSAGSQTLMEIGEQWESDSEDLGDATLGESPALLSDFLPSAALRSDNPEVSMAALEGTLPSHDRALVLCNSYVDHASLFFRPIKRDELLEELLPALYSIAAQRMQARVVGAASGDLLKQVDKTYPHDFALLYAIFAIGALFDLGLPACSAEAEHYFDLSRIALGLKQVTDSPQINTVRALGLMATYCNMVDKKYSRDTAWIGMSLTAKVAQTLGLHRDSARWKMDAKTVNKIRNLWWEVFSADMSHCLALGRPPAIHLSFVDCEFPIDEEATLSNAGEVENGFWRVKYIFSRDIFVPVLEATLAAKPLPYARILEIDRKIREMTFPESFKPYVKLSDGEAQFYSPSLSMRDFYLSQFRTVTMQYLHRSFFAQAVLDHPVNPLLSSFAPSFLTAYRCASIIVKAAAHQFDRCARMAMRVWFFVHHVFSAAIVVGTVVSRNPGSNLAPSALMDLTLAVQLFEQMAPHSHKARTALAVLNKLKDHAIRAYSEYNSITIPGSIPTNLTDVQDIDVATDCLAIFGGQARVLTKKHKSKPTSATATSSPGSQVDSPDSDMSTTNQTNNNVMFSDGFILNTNSDLPSDLSSEQVHPSLMEFLNGGTSDFTQASLRPPLPLLQPEHQIYQQQRLPVLQPSTMTNPLNFGVPHGSNTSHHERLSELYSAFLQYMDSKNTTSPSWSTVWASQGPEPELTGTCSSSFLPSPPQTAQNSPAPVRQLVPEPPQISAQPSLNSMFFQEPAMDTLSIPNAAATEMGLMTDSDLDSAWNAFLQECGIMPTT